MLGFVVVGGIMEIVVVLLVVWFDELVMVKLKVLLLMNFGFGV